MKNSYDDIKKVRAKPKEKKGKKTVEGENMNEDDTIKKQGEDKKKLRMTAEDIFSEPFLQILDITNEELLKEETIKYTELQHNMINGITEVIRLNMEPIDSRVLVMVFAKCLIAAIITGE